MALWSRWLPDVLPHVPGCPSLVAKHELRRAAQAFLITSRAWQQTLAAVAVGAGQSEVTLAAPDAQSKVVRAEAAWWDGKPLDPITSEELDKTSSDDWATHSGTPTHFLQLRPGVVTLYPAPSAGSSIGFKARVSLAPSDAATQLPDDLADRYSEQLAMGARARLMLYPNKPWSNPALGAAVGQAFSDAANEAKAQAARAQVGARIRQKVRWC